MSLWSSEEFFSGEDHYREAGNTLKVMINSDDCQMSVQRLRSNQGIDITDELSGVAVRRIVAYCSSAG